MENDDSECDVVIGIIWQLVRITYQYITGDALRLLLHGGPFFGTWTFSRSGASDVQTLTGGCGK